VGGGIVPLILHVDGELAASLPQAELVVSSKRQAVCAPDPDWMSCLVAAKTLLSLP